MRTSYISAQIFLILFLCILTPSGVGLVQTALAAQVALQWDPNGESDLAGYKVYFGTTSRAQTDSIDVGNATTYTVMGLLEGTTYFFTATAYNKNFLESGYSNEVSATTSSPCAYTISPSSQTFGASGGSGTVNVTASAGCPWAALPGISWITITSGVSGTGSGSMNYSIAPNSGGARSAAMTIAGRILTINQAAAATPAAFTITASAETGGTISPKGTISVKAGTSCFFKISPAPNYQISRVTVDGVPKGAFSIFTFYNVNANHTINVTFRRR